MMHNPILAKLERQLERFTLSPIAVGLDADYLNAAICHQTEQLGTIPVLGYRRLNKGQNTFQKKQFIYDKDKDVYHCPEGEYLIYKTTSREGYRHYHSPANVCTRCPQLRSCTQSVVAQ